MSEKYNWYAQLNQQVCDTLRVKPNSGLLETEFGKQQSTNNPNELINRGLKSPWLILREQLIAIVVVIFIVVAEVSALLGAVFLTFELQMAVVFVPLMQTFFKTVSLPPIGLA